MCDCLVALPPATSGGATIFAKNSDRPVGERQTLEWLPSRKEATTVCTHISIEGHPAHTFGALASRPTWMWGVEMGVNEAGVAIGNERIFTTVDPRAFPKALTGMDLVRLALERADTASTAVETIIGLIGRYGQGGTGLAISDSPYWSSFLIADPTGAWVLETSASTWAAERVEATRAISNRTTIPAFDAEHRHPRQPVATSVDPRLRVSTALLAEGGLTAERFMAHARSHDGPDGYTICMHVDGRFEPNPLHHQTTAAAMVAELPAGGEPVVWFADGSPCRTEFRRFAVGPPEGQPEV